MSDLQAQGDANAELIDAQRACIVESATRDALHRIAASGIVTGQQDYRIRILFKDILPELGGGFETGLFDRKRKKLSPGPQRPSGEQIDIDEGELNLNS